MNPPESREAAPGEASRTLPSLSIVTPSFNQAQFLEQTLRSVLEPGYPALEHQVMDGGSTDGSVELLRDWSSRHPQLRFVSEKDGGQSAALNAGFARTSGEIIGWINSDDFYAPGALHAAGRFFAAHPEVDWLCGRCAIVDAQGREQRGLATRYKDLLLRHYSRRWLFLENFISQPAVFFRRRLLERVGPLDESYRYAMDYHLWLRMAEVSRPAFLDAQLASFRSWGENKMSRAWRLAFDEQQRAAREVSGGRHPLWMKLHALNKWKLVAAYALLDRGGA